MAVYDMPPWLRAAAFEWGIAKGGAQFASPYNAGVQAVDFASQSWLCSITIPPRLWQEAGEPEAFFAELAGGVHRLRVPHMGRRQGEPRGTLRGAPTLASTMASGARTMVLANARGPRNLLQWSAFQADVEPNGLSDSLTSYAEGAPPGLVYGIGAVDSLNASRYQRTQCTGLSTGATQRAGWQAAVLTGPSIYTWSAYVRCTPGLTCAIAIYAYTAGNVLLGGADAYALPTGFAYQRMSVTYAAPAGTAYLLIYAWMYNAAGISQPFYVHDATQPQLEFGGAATDYDGPATIKAGDMLGAAGQLFMARTDAQANDAAAMTVSAVNAARVAIASGQGVTWQAPTCQMIMPASTFRVTHVPGLMQAVTVDLVEAP